MRALLPVEDLECAASQAPHFWRRHAGARLLLTGGTGFVGQWLVQTVQHANDTRDARIELLVLTRDPQAARSRRPQVFERADTRLVAADVARELPALGAFDLCIHAATDVGDSLRPADPLKVFDSIVSGTRRVLDAALSAGADRFLLTSSGAVYGVQPPELERVPETYTGAPGALDPKAAYGNGKRAAEWLAAAYSAVARDTAFAACSARIFALLGPGLPLDGGFAAGNFIRDILAGSSIRIQGDGRALRSYLYAADCAAWLLRILEDGAPGSAYNVGSEEAVSIAGLARAVASQAAREVAIEVAQKTPSAGPAPRYVPDTTKARTELRLSPSTSLGDAIARTIAWNRP